MRNSGVDDLIIWFSKHPHLENFYSAWSGEKFDADKVLQKQAATKKKHMPRFLQRWLVREPITGRFWKILTTFGVKCDTTVSVVEGSALDDEGEATLAA